VLRDQGGAGALVDLAVLRAVGGPHGACRRRGRVIVRFAACKPAGTGCLGRVVGVSRWGTVLPPREGSGCVHRHLPRGTGGTHRSCGRLDSGQGVTPEVAGPVSCIRTVPAARLLLIMHDASTAMQTASPSAGYQA
jgi:hypothetical protein